MRNEINYNWTIRNPNQVETLKRFLKNEKVNKVKYDKSLYEVSMYE